MPVPQLVRRGKSLTGGNRLAVDGDYCAVVCTNNTTFATIERTVLNDCLNMVRDCFNVNVLGSSDTKVFE